MNFDRSSLYKYDFAVEMENASFRIYPFNHAITPSCTGSSWTIEREFDGAMKGFDIEAFDRKTDTFIKISLNKCNISKLYTYTPAIVNLLKSMEQRGQEPRVSVEHIERVDTLNDEPLMIDGRYNPYFSDYKDVKLSIDIYVVTSVMYAQDVITFICNYSGHLYKSDCYGQF